MSEVQQPRDHYDLCIIGAGIGGLNALYVASRYLRTDQRVALVDKRRSIGGMWVDTYDYVRLHQPHPFFTTGDVKWTFGKEPSHLASKDEVLDHFHHCLEEARKGVGVAELLEHEVLRIDEGDGAVQVSCRTPGGSEVTISADRVINAIALDIEPLQPLTLSSSRVRSVSPETCDMATGEIAGDRAPVWVVGSGKTGMDTAHALITQQPGREVNLVAGTGTFFMERERLYPVGWQRWWRGTRPNSVLVGATDRFDGTNELEMFAWVRDRFGTGPIPQAQHFFLGALSAAESSRVSNGLGRVVQDHLVDAVDTADGVRLTLRSGASVDVEPGSWIVNCTSHFRARDDAGTVPYVSGSGRVVTIGAPGLFGFSSFGGYFLTHLLYTDTILEAPLLQIDLNPLLKISPPAAVAGALTLSQYNLGVAFDHLPARVFRELGLDFDRWYPLPRRLVGQVDFLLRHKRRREHYRRALETLGRRFDIPVSPVVQTASRSALRSSA